MRVGYVHAARRSNARAAVYLPGARVEQVREGSTALGSTPGITQASQVGDMVVVEAGSGSYEFAYEAPALAARLRGGARH